MSRIRHNGMPSSIAGQYGPALILVGLAVFLIVLNLFFPSLVSRIRITFTDLLAPFMHAAAKPSEALQGVSSAWESVASVREENKRLQQQIDELHEWRDLAQQQASENRSLKGLMKYKDDSVMSFLTARVIAEVGGNFNNSVIVTAGSRDGVVKDMIAMGEEGVVGRVIEAGEWSSRVLLFNDLNFRLPVMLEGTQLRAILTGEGSGSPLLLYLPTEVEIKPGTRVVTSGHGGLFPAHLPVGTVQGRKGQDVVLAPYAKLDRLQMVRLVQYNLAGGAQNPLNQELKQAAPDVTAPPAKVP
ncbi:MAG: rod shape-determining protein MreC [Alphaproteobacteria bacterium]|nr:rod shape-determining protein MreC [Alphaproteobacteria bacterium]